MKKFLVNILAFFAIVAVIDLGVGCLGDYLTSHVRSGDTKRTYDLAMQDCHDVLILGSSRARHHYDATFLSDTLGLDVYNAGYDGNGIVLAYGLLELSLERYRPQLIIYDVEPSFDINVYEQDNNHKRYISRLKPYYQHKAVGNIIKDVSREEWYKVHSGLMRYNMNILTMLTEGLRNSKDSRKGFTPLEGIYESDLKFSDGHGKVDPFKVQYVENLIDLSQSKQIPIMFVASPRYGRETSSELQPIIDLCARQNVRFIDYYVDEEFMQHKEWFKEPVHLNSEGARVFSNRIVSDIKSVIKY